MLRSSLKSKIHRATVTQADVNYVGSLSLDSELAELADFQEYEEVMVADITSGERLYTYIIYAEPGSRTVGLNGAAALKILEGHKIIVFSFAQYTEEEALLHEPKLIFVDGDNNPVPGPKREKHGQIA